jgi:hypothetical protein
MESDAHTRPSRGFNGMIGLVSAVDLGRLTDESAAAANAAGPGAPGNTAEPVVVLRDRNVRAWVALFIGALVLICIALVDLYAAEPRPHIEPSVTGSAE